MEPNSTTTRSVALRSIEIMADGDRHDFNEVVAPGAVNHEAQAEPPACRVAGPEGFHATSVWLRAAFADLNHTVAEGALVVVDTTMSGRHVKPFVIYNADGTVDTVWAPTGKTFAVRQSHWLRVNDGMVIEHWAVRDDLSQSFQLGWVPPSPLYLLRCALAKRQAIQASSPN